MITNCSRLSAFLLAFACVGAPLASPRAEEPAPKKPVSDEYHGVTVTEDYRWLEVSADPATQAWTEAQNQRTRAYLDALADRAPIEKRLTELFAKVSPTYRALASRPGRLFALKQQPPKQQALLVTLTSANDLGSEKVILDPNELEPKGQFAMDWFVPSPDGKLVAACLSQGGSEDGMLHFYKTDTGEELTDKIPRVQYPTGGGSAAWTPDSRGVYYTRYPHAGEKPEADLNFFQQIYFHQLGTPETADTYSAGKDFPRIAEILLDTSRDGRSLLAAVANGDGGEFAHYLLDLTVKGAAWRQITRFEDGVKAAALSVDGQTLYLRSVKDSPKGKVLSLPRKGSRAELKDATLVVPESGDAVIQHLALGAGHLYVADLIGGPSRVRRFDLDGRNGVEIPLPPISGVTDILALDDKAADDRLLFRQTSYVAPYAWHLYDPTADNAQKTALAGTSPVDFSDIEAVREFAASKDGTRVPLNIIRRKGTKLDGNNPTLLYGYGGYGVNLEPAFDFTQRLWFDRGGISVVANLRGGGEFGEAWHLAGNLTKKQNVFDDFAAAAQYLIDQKYTNSARLAIEGGSNGGLLMGAFLTQHPGLARAVVSHVGIYDMLRVELDPNGAFNVTEFGSVKNEAQFKALLAYSPYHHVADGTKYPAVFMLTGDNDGRVNPANSRKMTARLQAANASAHPILLRTTSKAGHGQGTALTERIAQASDVFAFLFDQLGMPQKSEKTVAAAP